MLELKISEETRAVEYNDMDYFRKLFTAEPIVIMP
jgi:hypothetical protein